MATDGASTKTRRTGRLVLVIVIALLIPIIPFVVIGELPGEAWVQAQGDDAVRFGAAGAAVLAADVLIPVPSSLVGTLLGGRLGFIPGFLWSFLGLMLGNLAGYGLGRLVHRRGDEDVPDAPARIVVVLSRPVPVLAEGMTFAAGATGMRLLSFLLAIGIGNAIYAAALAGSGAALLPDGLAGPGLVVPLAIPLLGWAIWKWVARRSVSPSGHTLAPDASAGDEETRTGS